MATLSELIRAGVTKARLPNWNRFAYVEPRPDGPWADLHDVFGLSGSILIVECDRDDRWEAWDGP